MDNDIFDNTNKPQNKNLTINDSFQKSGIKDNLNDQNCQNQNIKPAEISAYIPNNGRTSTIEIKNDTKSIVSKTLNLPNSLKSKKQLTKQNNKLEKIKKSVYKIINTSNKNTIGSKSRSTSKNKLSKTQVKAINKKTPNPFKSSTNKNKSLSHNKSLIANHTSNKSKLKRTKVKKRAINKKQVNINIQPSNKKDKLNPYLDKVINIDNINDKGMIEDKKKLDQHQKHKDYIEKNFNKYLKYPTNQSKTKNKKLRTKNKRLEMNQNTNIYYNISPYGNSILMV